MVGQNAHSVKVVGFRIYSSQPASTAPFCRCTFLSGLIPTTAIRKFIPARNAASRSSVRGRYLGDALEIVVSTVKIDFSSRDHRFQEWSAIHIVGSHVCALVSSCQDADPAARTFALSGIENPTLNSRSDNARGFSHSAFACETPAASSFNRRGAWIALACLSRETRREENTMGVIIGASLLLTAWVAFVFSRHNPDRRISSGSAHPPRPKRAPHRWYR